MVGIIASKSRSISGLSCVSAGLRPSRMPGSSALYWSDNFMVVTRLRAAVMASGDGACADTAQIENTSMLTMSNRRLDMVSSGDRSRDNRVTVCSLARACLWHFSELGRGWFPAQAALTRIRLSAAGPALGAICRVDRMPERPHHRGAFCLRCRCDRPYSPPIRDPQYRPRLRPGDGGRSRPAVRGLGADHPQGFERSVRSQVADPDSWRRHHRLGCREPGL